MRKRKRQQAEFDEGLLAGAGAAGTDAGGQADPGSAASVAPEAVPGIGESGVGEGGGGGGGGQGRRVSPVDIQQKVFRTAFRGYSEREVDVFLDQVTEEMARLMAENRSLRDQAQRAEMRPTTPLGFADDRALAEARAEAARAIQEARAEADRILREAGTDAARIQAEALATGDRPAAGSGAVAPGAGASPGGQALPRDFIHRERTFLQNLAELIQSHAEAVRQDARRSRGSGPVRAEPPQPPAADAGTTERATDPEPGTVLGGEASALAAIAEASGGDTGASDAALGAEAEPAAPSEQPEPPSPPERAWSSAPVAPQEPGPQDRGSHGGTAERSEAAAAAGTPEGAWSPEEPPELRATEPRDAGGPEADEEPRVLELEAAPHTAPSDAEEFAFDVRRGEAATAGGQDLLPWEAEQPAPPSSAPEGGRREQPQRAQPEGAEATSSVRRFGEPARYAVGLPGPPSWETPRAPSATGEDREEERRSLRELFWGED